MTLSRGAPETGLYPRYCYRDENRAFQPQPYRHIQAARLSGRNWSAEVTRVASAAADRLAAVNRAADTLVVMRRPGVIVVAGALLTVLLGAGAWLLPLPYVVQMPGPTVDTVGRHDGNQVITVTGGTASASAGQLRLTTVQIDTEVGLRDAIRSWFDDDLALIPRSAVFPPGLTDQQVERKNAELFTSSQNTAQAVALRELGYPAKAPDRPLPTVEINLKDIGGPSAGLMFTLGIVDRLTPADLTGGRIIAGTGTVDDGGAVGPISGIPQKLLGAKAAGAQLFLVPEANCAEAVRNAVPGLPMAKVATVGEALDALRTYVGGGSPASCAAVKG
jgi:Lon-like protease